MVREVQSASGLQILQPLRESVRQARESPHLHSDGQVLPLDKRCAHMRGFGHAANCSGYNLQDWAWGIAFISMLAIVAVQLLELRVIGIPSKGLLDGLGIENIGICG